MANSAKISFSEGASRLELHRWTRAALFRNASKERSKIDGIHFDEKYGLAVATTGHCLFASREDYDPALAGKTVLAKPWFLSNKIELVEDQNFPDWVMVLPNEPTRVIQARIPDGLLVHCRVVEHRCVVNGEQGEEQLTFCTNEEIDEVLRKQKDDRKNQHLRLLNPDFFSVIQGRSVLMAWERLNDFGPVVILPDEQGTLLNAHEEVTKSKLLTNWSWFMIVMPMRHDIS